MTGDNEGVETGCSFASRGVEWWTYAVDRSLMMQCLCGKIMFKRVMDNCGTWGWGRQIGVYNEVAEVVDILWG